VGPANESAVPWGALLEHSKETGLWQAKGQNNGGGLLLR